MHTAFGRATVPRTVAEPCVECDAMQRADPPLRARTPDRGGSRELTHVRGPSAGRVELLRAALRRVASTRTTDYNNGGHEHDLQS